VSVTWTTIEPYVTDSGGSALTSLPVTPVLAPIRLGGLGTERSICGSICALIAMMMILRDIRSAPMKGYPVIPRTVVISLCSLQNISLYAQLAKPRFQLRSQ